MIWGLPFWTFFFVFIVPVLAIILSIVYAVTFKDDDTWFTFEDLTKKKNHKK